MLSACSIANAKTYSKDCEVSSCDGGWKVSVDKAKCEANQCLCPNGVGSSGAKCLIDGDPKCESCNAGFKLASDSKACSGIAGDCTGKKWVLTEALCFLQCIAVRTVVCFLEAYLVICGSQSLVEHTLWDFWASNRINRRTLHACMDVDENTIISVTFTVQSTL